MAKSQTPDLFVENELVSMAGNHPHPSLAGSRRFRRARSGTIDESEQVGADVLLEVPRKDDRDREIPRGTTFTA